MGAVGEFDAQQAMPNVSRALLILCAGVLGLILACSDEPDETVKQGPSSTTHTGQAETAPPTAPVPPNGGAAPFYQEPVRLTSGTYFSRAGTPEGQTRGMEALAAEAGKEKFEGDINGFSLYTYEHAIRDPSVDRKWCGGGKIVEFREAEVFEFGYLLPGTFAWSPQFQSFCDDGSIANAGQRLSAGNITFTVSYVPGELSLAHDASVDRVFQTRVNGQPGVEIRPITEEGFGRTWIAFAAGDGFIVVDGVDMPLADARNLAEGVKCVIC